MKPQDVKRGDSLATFIRFKPGLFRHCLVIVYIAMPSKKDTFKSNLAIGFLTTHM